MGADPLVGSLLTLAAMRGYTMNGFLVRKDGTIEGEIIVGQTAIIIEDVITTGARRW